MAADVGYRCTIWEIVAALSFACSLAACAPSAEADEAETGEGAVVPGSGCDRYDDFPKTRLEEPRRLDAVTDSAPIEHTFVRSGLRPFLNQGEETWFVFTAEDESSNARTTLQPTIELSKNATGFSVCAFVQRDDLACLRGRATREERLPTMLGCCDESRVSLDLDRSSANDSTRVYVRVQSRADSCRPFNFAWAATPTVLGPQREE
jgi:hypothetical protein